MKEARRGGCPGLTTALGLCWAPAASVRAVGRLVSEPGPRLDRKAPVRERRAGPWWWTVCVQGPGLRSPSPVPSALRVLRHLHHRASPRRQVPLALVHLCPRPLPCSQALHSLTLRLDLPLSLVLTGPGGVLAVAARLWAARALQGRAPWRLGPVKAGQLLSLDAGILSSVASAGKRILSPVKCCRAFPSPP